MLGFVIGLMIGGLVGVCMMAILSVASSEDDWMERYYSDKEL